MTHTTSLRRFAGHEIDPTQVRALSPDNAALSEGRTIFPSTVVPTMTTPRLLVSGHNNPKLGKEITKGARKGWPIFQLTLEERATCPRSCAQWAGCYGNSMNQARRHTPDAYFLPRLRVEVAALARTFPEGFLVRLHTLGDFYSVEYVLAWAQMVAEHRALHVFGYTARRIDDDDPETRRIARAIRLLTDHRWGRFAIRTSAPPMTHRVGTSYSIVVDEDPNSPDTIVCPAQKHDTETCGTCGLCWAPAARDKTIAFLRHGMTTRRAPRAPAKPAEIRQIPPKLAPERAAPRKPAMERITGASRDAGAVAAFQRQDDERLVAAIQKLSTENGEATVSLRVLAEVSGIPHGSVLFVARRLTAAGRLRVTPSPRVKGSPLPNTYTLLGATAAPLAELRAPPGPTLASPPLSDQQARVLATLARHAFEGTVSLQRAALVREANVPSGSVVYLTDCLVRKGYLETVEVGGHGRATIYRVLKAPPGDPLVTAGSPTPQPQPANPGSPEINLSTPAPKRAPRPVEPEAPVARIAPPLQVDLSRLAEDEAAPTLGPKTLMTLRARECRWPEGEPGRDGQAYCGERVAGDTPYCSKHLARMHPPPKGKTTGEARP